ncbi:hypothetical protein U2I54_16195 [Bacillus pseudomycoides]|uniref:DUF1657 domain-containing protein n=1 Tax=Bacillus bingmayongensis TaxID=1150157 RepID=A0ABU5JZV5_9BACI|nr:hypothetical protein [Bacillus pseudomycoides]
MKNKHGLSQYRINHAKDHAVNVADKIAKVEMLFHLSQTGHIEEEKAENGISYLIEEIEDSTKYLLEYIRQRDDMR